mgnify:CR=1 FL=1
MVGIRLRGSAARAWIRMRASRGGNPGRTAAGGICTLEQRLFTGEMKIGFPLIPGHEASGEVVAAGADVPPGFAAGTHVALDLVLRCGVCHYCRTGQSNMCQNRFAAGQKVLGEVDAARLGKLQDFYLAKGFIQKATPVNELYTNEFVK